MKKIPFNSPHLAGKEFEYVSNAYRSGHLAGGGEYTKLAQSFLEKKLKCKKVLLTHSCTAALEMSAILANVMPGDEVIMPSFTFVSTANAFVLRGAIPVFIDIKKDTLNMDEKLIEAAITSKTKAIAPVHYAGVGCEMDSIMAIAKSNNLMVIEDAAQAYLSKYNNENLGTIGNLAALSFHETKNVISGEGGALLINDESIFERAEIIWEKGTNRSKFFRGQVDKYTWVDVGSSFLPSEIMAAFLLAQLEKGELITRKRLKLWNRYDEKLKKLQALGLIKLPRIPANTSQNAHIYYIILKNLEVRQKLISYLNSLGIMSVFHYIPLHSSPAGLRFGKIGSKMDETDSISNTLLRLPLFFDLKLHDQDRVVDAVYKYFGVTNLNT